MSFYRTILTAAVAIALASPVFADDQATVNTQDTTAATQTTNTDQTTTKINLNKATLGELTKVNGLNKQQARKILAYRKKHGEFKSIDDLIKVRGINKSTLQNVQDQLTVE